jgi:hypothetical protein
MTIREIIENLEQWQDQERETNLRPLLKLLSPMSLATLREHQIKHFSHNPIAGYEEFVEGQNKEIKTCLELEMSDFGKVIRENLGLKPLTLETETNHL